MLNIVINDFRRIKALWVDDNKSSWIYHKASEIQNKMSLLDNNLLVLVLFFFLCL